MLVVSEKFNNFFPKTFVLDKKILNKSIKLRFVTQNQGKNSRAQGKTQLDEKSIEFVSLIQILLHFLIFCVDGFFWNYEYLYLQSVEETPLGDLLIRSIAQPITYLKNDFSQTEEGSSSASVKKGSKRVPKFFRVNSESPQPVPVFKQPKSKNVNQEVEEQQQRLLQQQACSQNVSQGDTSQ